MSESDEQVDSMLHAENVDSMLEAVDSVPTPGRPETSQTVFHITCDMFKRINLYGKRKMLSPASPEHPEYNDYEARLESFRDWPRLSPAKPKDLAAAGFFYHGYRSGVVDCVKCFYCDQGLCLWEVGDIPFEEHVRFNKNCPFVRSINKN